jgi:hypothetical protein
MQRVGTRFEVRLRKLVAAATGLLLSASAHADTTWTNSVDGSWTNVAAWDNGIPSSNAAFLTNSTGSYTVRYEGGGNVITNVVVSNASIGNTTTLSVNSGTLTVSGSQSAGGIVIQSNAVLNAIGGLINNSSQLSISQGGIVSVGAEGASLAYDDFESYTNTQILAIAVSNTVAGSPWGRFGLGTLDNPTAYTNRGVAGSVAAQFGVGWGTGTNNASMVYWFPSTTNLAAFPGVTIDLRISNVTAIVSNTVVKAGFEQTDGTIWQTKASLAATLSNEAYQTFAFNYSSADMERSAGSGPFDLSIVRNLRLRFENAGQAGTQHILLDNFQGSPGVTWNQTAGNVSIGDAGDGTLIIRSGGLVTGQANVPCIGRNSLTGSASNGIGRLYIAGGTYLWPGRSGSANGLFIGRGQTGIVTVSNGWFILSSTAATNGLRVGAADSTVFAPGTGLLEVLGGVVTNTGFLQSGVGMGADTNFGAGTISVSGGSFYQLGMAGDVRLGFTNFDRGYLIVSGTGTFISTNTVNVGWSAGSGGRVEVSGTGQLKITNSANAAVLLLSGNGGTGTLILSGGSTTVDRLIATNGADSIIAFNRGVLSVRNRTIAGTGAPVTVGNGTDAATLALLGGLHTFNDGLNISGNATLRGAAVIDGQPVTITSGGVLSPGTGIGTLTISNDLTVTGGVLEYELGTNSDRTVVSGALSVTGTLSVTDAGGFTNGSYVLFNYGTLGTLAVSIGALPADFSGTVSNDTGNSQVVLNVTSGAPPLDPFATWQFDYFGSTNCALCGGDADFDGDGISNTNEFLAGTTPTNSASAFRVVTTAKSANDITVTWTTVGGKTNVVQVGSGTASGSYTNNFADLSGPIVIAGSGDVTTNYVDVGGATNAPARYYRVRLAP